ncbi:hypothetical protein LWI29_003867 [Acer saccharum]|uniref:DUF4283 domain-containing protein n=1 Tax=Acer saccharum TaxID=4024 RepID=A0AA39W029_ACESA|nr:hypothetical protein LWI29_003867 [Acer saccharum]
MLVYGWPIVSKVASYGWSNKRSSLANQRSFVRDETAEGRRGDGEFKRKDVTRSFMEVLRGNQVSGSKSPEKEKEDVKLLKMTWDFRQEEHEWLSRCAVGVLKDFVEVFRVNKRLIDAGIMFSSSYLRDKSILWCLDSISHKEAFIYDRFFWADSFSAMVKWSNSVVPQSRIACMNCRGVPLSCWSPNFFKNLGWQVREPLLVDEVKVAAGLKSYDVDLVEDVIPVDLRGKEVGEFAFSKNPQAGKDRDFLGQRCQVGKSSKEAKNGVIGQRKLIVGKMNRGYGDRVAKLRLVKGALEKGKKKWGSVYSPEVRSTSSEEVDRNRYFLDSTKLRRECSMKLANQIENNCEGAKPDSLVDNFLSGGPHKPKWFSCVKPFDSPAWSFNKADRVEFCVNLGLVEECSSKDKSHRILKPIFEEVAFFKSSFEEADMSVEACASSDNKSTKNTMVVALVAIEEERAREDELVMSARIYQNEGEVPNPLFEVENGSVCAEGGGISSERSCRDEGMDQILAAVEKEGVDSIALEKMAAGVVNDSSASIFKNRKHSMKTRSSKIQPFESNQVSSLGKAHKQACDAEDEIAKTIEIGVLLGLDFNGKEKELADVIARREEEDVARFNEFNGT